MSEFLKEITLDMLEKGDKALVVGLDESKIPLKLFELGCFVGSSVKMIEKALFDDPLYVCIDDSYMTIRKDVAQGITVKKFETL